MKRIGTLLMFILFGSILVFSQNDENDVISDTEATYFIGIDTGTSNNFSEIKTTIEDTEGIRVLSYCNKNNIIKLSFSKKYFIELTSIFDFIEKRFDGSICYHMKHYTDESYNKMCHSELVKRNLGGTE